ncbi:Imm7 family immunity protein [Seohaeicola nanhaiensis]|uniref:Imm7 family immunity protein n=1 Tax=Seohaeicola nanhaiensis TaxID=1387282 RepID=A0ABV9KP92_9RHOB
MFEYQGWVTILGSYDEDGAPDVGIDEIFELVKQEVERIKHFEWELGMRYFNGSPRLWVIGFNNRPAGQWDEIFSLFSLISKIAPNSYGHLSFYDDELGPGKSDNYYTYVLRKGSMTLEKDPFLSPLSEKVE